MTGKRGRPKSKGQQSLTAPKQETAPARSGSIVPTDSWLNQKGNAIYVNIPEKDVILTVGKDGNKRLSFITSVVAVKNMVDGEKKGVNLGRFEA